MRNTIGALLLTLCASSAFGVVADGDLRPHPSLTTVENAKDCAPISIVSREQIERLMTSYQLILKPGFRVAAVLFKDKSRDIVSSDVKVDRPLISLVGRGGNPIDVLVDQLDQAKPLAQLVDVVDPSCLASPVETTVTNKNEEVLPPGMQNDPKDPASSIIASPVAMLDLCKKLALNLKPGFHAYRVVMKMPISSGGGTLTVTSTLASPDDTRGILIGTKNGDLQVLVLRDDNVSMPTDSKVSDVVVESNPSAPVTP